MCLVAMYSTTSNPGSCHYFGTPADESVAPMRFVGPALPGVLPAVAAAPVLARVQPAPDGVQPELLRKAKARQIMGRNQSTGARDWPDEKGVGLCSHKMSTYSTWRPKINFQVLCVLSGLAATVYLEASRVPGLFGASGRLRQQPSATMIC